jgi:hypothetical protein
MQNLIGKYVENRAKLQGGVDSVASEEKVCYIVQVDGNPSVATRGPAGPGGSDTQPGLGNYRTMSTPPGQTGGVCRSGPKALLFPGLTPERRQICPT